MLRFSSPAMIVLGILLCLLQTGCGSGSKAPAGSFATPEAAWEGYLSAMEREDLKSLQAQIEPEYYELMMDRRKTEPGFLKGIASTSRAYKVEFRKLDSPQFSNSVGVFPTDSALAPKAQHPEFYTNPFVIAIITKKGDGWVYDAHEQFKFQLDANHHTAVIGLLDEWVKNPGIEPDSPKGYAFKALKCSKGQAILAYPKPAFLSEMTVFLALTQTANKSVYEKKVKCEEIPAIIEWTDCPKDMSGWLPTY